jgi:hypothetical protein
LIAAVAATAKDQHDPTSPPPAKKIVETIILASSSDNDDDDDDDDEDVKDLLSTADSSVQIVGLRTRRVSIDTIIFLVPHPIDGSLVPLNLPVRRPSARSDNNPLTSSWLALSEGKYLLDLVPDNTCAINEGMNGIKIRDVSNLFDTVYLT